MPAQARVGDKAMNPADSHGCPVCPHSVQGPGLNGSTNILVNGKPPLRVGDPGAHSACCGPNSWVVAQGSSTVFFNNIPAARMSDTTTHCGGVGQLIEGSDSVITGG